MEQNNYHSTTIKLLEQASIHSGLLCPRCQSDSFKKYGKVKGIQRFMCKECNKTLRHTTDTPFHWMHKKQLANAYIKILHRGISIRKAAAELNISTKTAFKWRHKFLTSLQKSEQSPSLPLVTGAGIIKTPYSAKGSRKKTDKSKPDIRTLILLSPTYPIKLCKLESRKQCEIKQALSHNINPKSLIINLTKKHSQLTSYEKRHKTIKDQHLSEPYKKQLSINQNEMILWIKRFKGVASKYLQQYWNWFISRQNSFTFKDPQMNFTENILSSRNLSFLKTLT